MKKLLLIVVLAVISCNKKADAPTAAADTTAKAIDTTTVTTTSTTVAGPDTTGVIEHINATLPDPIVDIRKKVGHINTASLEKKHYEFKCDEKMMVDYFYENGQIVKIAVDFGTVGDVYAKEGYYYHNGKLIFIYEYTEGGAVCENCKLETNEYRSYIEEDFTVRYLKNRYAQPCKKCSFTASSRQYTLLKAKNAAEVKAILCR